ncbi:hypothetical protein LIER_27755 [Lithospermum erythrorhizon]|uniref:Integrase catalytic domain-containing protein n=1 Tax=Lithospermum erythrorhizon TaxID=34254 RepID=A0AAV3RD69_LITER
MPFRHRGGSSHERSTFWSMRWRGAHQTGAKLHFQIKRMRYYWPTMVKDCMEYAQSYKPCQFHANFIHKPPEPLYPTTPSWPFDSWGMDMVGPMPESAEGHVYLLSAIDYFSKWVEAVSLLCGKKEEVPSFIKSNITIMWEEEGSFQLHQIQYYLPL